MASRYCPNCQRMVEVDREKPSTAVGCVLPALMIGVSLFFWPLLIATIPLSLFFMLGANLGLKRYCPICKCPARKLKKRPPMPVEPHQQPQARRSA